MRDVPGGLPGALLLLLLQLLQLHSKRPHFLYSQQDWKPVLNISGLENERTHYKSAAACSLAARATHATLAAFAAHQQT